MLICTVDFLASVDFKSVKDFMRFLCFGFFVDQSSNQTRLMSILCRLSYVTEKGHIGPEGRYFMFVGKLSRVVNAILPLKAFLSLTASEGNIKIWKCKKCFW